MNIFISNILNENSGAQNDMCTIIATLESIQEKDHMHYAKFY